MTMFLCGMAMIPAFFLRGWAVSTLWAWFLVPLGMPTLGLAQAIGVSLTISYLTTQGVDTEPRKDREKYFTEGATNGLLYPPIAVGYRLDRSSVRAMTRWLRWLVRFFADIRRQERERFQ